MKQKESRYSSFSFFSTYAASLIALVVSPLEGGIFGKGAMRKGIGVMRARTHYNMDNMDKIFWFHSIPYCIFYEEIVYLEEDGPYVIYLEEKKYMYTLVFIIYR